MADQTQINAAGQPVGRAGQIADCDIVVDVLTGFNSEATAAIAFGEVVKRDTTDASGRSFKKLAALADTPDGISVFSYRHQPGTTGDLDASGNQIAGAAMDIMNRGRIFVLAETLYNPGDRAYVRAIATGTLAVGQLSNTANASYLTDITKQAKFVTGGAAGSLATVEVDFSNLK